MIYIHAIGSRNIGPGERPDLKAEFKALTGCVIRRSDRFINLALVGACQAAAGRSLSADTGVFMTSGQGNLAVLSRIGKQKFEEKQLPKPVDFINLLSNSAGFYLAEYLGLRGKNLFLAHHGFPVQMALLLAETDLQLGIQRQLLLGGVDERFESASASRKFLGLDERTPLGEGSNWFLLSNRPQGAIATLEIVPRPLRLEDVASRIEGGAQVGFGLRFALPEAEALCNAWRADRFRYEEECGFYETATLFAVNHFLLTRAGTLFFVDRCEDRYMVIKLTKANPETFGKTE